MADLDHLRRRITTKPRKRLAYAGLRTIGANLVEADLPGAQVGEACEFIGPDGDLDLAGVVLRVVGDSATIGPVGYTDGLSTRTLVRNLGCPLSIEIRRGLFGAVSDYRGRPIGGFEAGQLRNGNGKGSLELVADAATSPLRGTKIKLDQRRPVVEPMMTGIRAIDGFMTIGRGQRMSITGEAGAGKSSLISMLVRNAQADAIVVGLVGERGREVAQFLSHDIPKNQRGRTAVLAATSDTAPMERVACAQAATAVAEGLAVSGKQVILVLDSLTRYIRALREVALQAGEPPARRGYPASVYAEVPRLIERAGNFDSGSLTAIYTLLDEGGDLGDPMVDELVSLTDGHIKLSRKLASEGHYPAIDIVKSQSRLMPQITDRDHLKSAAGVRQLLAKYAEIEILIQIGDYKEGSDAIADRAIVLKSEIDSFLQQGLDDTGTFASIKARLKELAG